MNLRKRQPASPNRRRATATRVAALALPMLLVAAGCGSAVKKYISNPLNPIFAIVPSARTIDTNGQAQIKAVATAGGAAPVSWTIVSGENDATFGQGSIDGSGNYTPPAALTRDSIEVEIQAQLHGDASKTATEVIEVRPGFLQPLTPENASLAPGGSIEVSAQLAEVGGGSIDWHLAATSSGARRLNSAYGSFSQQNCEHSPRDYTVCTAIFTAPTRFPAANEVYIVASVSAVDGTLPSKATQQSLHVLFNGSGVSSSPLLNQSIQSSLVQLGSSGGNNNDADTADGRAGSDFINDCCGGTLGALLRDESGSQYILSNNHVLAESDQAKVGDAIFQPALIDRDCDQNAGRPVASLRYIVPLGTPETNVDAALAEVNTGTVDPSGAILQLGSATSGSALRAAAPAAGSGEALTPERLAPEAQPLFVAKSGRTTGLTCSTIDAVDLSVQVDYYKDCAETQPFYHKTFTGQIGIGGDGFSDSGDSGALVVDAANAQPLGLYFAGGADGHGGGFSVASPIRQVLSELSVASGHQFSVVGGAEHQVSCLNYDARTPSLASLPEPMRRKAETAVRRNAPTLVNLATGILEIAAGASADSQGDAAVIVYVDKSNLPVTLPETIGGVRTVIVPTDQATLNSGTATKSPQITPGIHLSEAALQAAQAVQKANAVRLMADPAIFGVGVTQSRDNPAEAALLMLVDQSRVPRATPAVIGGLRTRYVYLNRFHVTRSRHAGAPHPSSCELRSLRSSGDSPHFTPDKPTPIRLP